MAVRYWRGVGVLVDLAQGTSRAHVRGFGAAKIAKSRKSSTFCPYQAALSSKPPDLSAVAQTAPDHRIQIGGAGPCIEIRAPNSETERMRSRCRGFAFVMRFLNIEIMRE
jgi:hypothetical protein